MLHLPRPLHGRLARARGTYNLSMQEIARRAIAFYLDARALSPATWPADE
jgi:hypothetical protein